MKRQDEALTDRERALIALVAEAVETGYKLGVRGSLDPFSRQAAIKSNVRSLRLRLLKLLRAK